LTSSPSGSYNPVTGEYKLEWTSTIEGGPFDGFTGLWHLEGTFDANAEPVSAPGGTGSPNGSTAGPTGSGSDDEAGTTSGSSSTPASASASGSGKALPFTGPELPAWLGTAFLTNGALFGLAALAESRKKGRIR
jgi:hypothetical protein